MRDQKVKYVHNFYTVLKKKRNVVFTSVVFTDVKMINNSTVGEL